MKTCSSVKQGKKEQEPQKQETRHGKPSQCLKHTTGIKQVKKVRTNTKKKGKYS